MKTIITSTMVLFLAVKSLMSVPHDETSKPVRLKEPHKIHARNKIKKGFSSNEFFKLDLKNGEKLGNIFSRIISYKSTDFPEVVFRVGGTGIYTVIDNNSAAPVFDGLFRYDGRPESKSKLTISDDGKTTNYDGNSATNTDGSGVMFNSLIWGTPPAEIHKGDSWQVKIPQAWELGGAGLQTVTVMDIDEANHTIRLQREGNSEGFYDNDARQLTVVKDGKNIKMDITPGQSHWIGYTTFKNGLVISDELMATHSLTLTSGDLKFDAQQREYILLNAMPVAG